MILVNIIIIEEAVKCALLDKLLEISPTFYVCDIEIKKFYLVECYIVSVTDFIYLFTIALA